jgi:FPC/CPF motif-containing protein YcgG
MGLLTAFMAFTIISKNRIRIAMATIQVKAVTATLVLWFSMRFKGFLIREGMRSRTNIRRPMNITIRSRIANNCDTSFRLEWGKRGST